MEHLIISALNSSKPPGITRVPIGGVWAFSFSKCSAEVSELRLALPSNVLFAVAKVRLSIQIRSKVKYPAVFLPVESFGRGWLTNRAKHSSRNYSIKILINVSAPAETVPAKWRINRSLPRLDGTISMLVKWNHPSFLLWNIPATPRASISTKKIGDQPRLPRTKNWPCSKISERTTLVLICVYKTQMAQSVIDDLVFFFLFIRVSVVLKTDEFFPR